MQAVLLYRSDIWVITESMMKVLEVFHHRISRRIAGKTAHHVRLDGWESPPVDKALGAAVLWTMLYYVRR